MKTIKRTTLVMIALVIASVTWGQDKKANNIDNSNIALQGYSPVSYLDNGLAQLGSKQFKSEHNKLAYYFTSVEQRELFDKNPEKYLPQYGGYCAFGIYAGAKFRVDPNKFIVKNGKYYLYLNDVEVDARELWLAEKNHNQLVTTANKNWKKLSITYN